MVSVARSGGWGDVEWVHLLECGHSDSRKRAVPVGKPIGCVRCVLAEQFQRELSTTVDNTEPELTDLIAIEVASTEAEVARIRAAVAAAVHVNVDAVDVVWGAEGLQYVMVMLTATEVHSLLL